MLKSGVQKGLDTSQKCNVLYYLSRLYEGDIYIILCNDFFNYKLYSALYGQNRSRFGREGFVLEILI